MNGLSEIVASVVLLLATVILSLFVMSIFFNSVYGPSHVQLALQEAEVPCTAMIVAVVNDSGKAVLYVENPGSKVCSFDMAYLIQNGSVVAADALPSTVLVPPEPAPIAVKTPLPYGAGYIYRLTGPTGDVAVGES
ncbi:MAG: flagellar biosynthesis protein FlaG [Thermoproteus sp.]